MIWIALFLAAVVVVLREIKLRDLERRLEIIEAGIKELGAIAEAIRGGTGR